VDPAAAADAFLAVACDDGVDDGLRVEAAEHLARVDQRAAAGAFQTIH
jgi:hypothetical protein